MEKWNWTEPTEEEFEKRRFGETFYRIYHKDVDGNATVDYKFWAKDDASALSILEEYKVEHSGDGIDYYYSTSGYFLDSDGKRYDTMEEMHKSKKAEPYDDEMRSYDIDSIENVRKNLNAEGKTAVTTNLVKWCRNTLDRIGVFWDSTDRLKDKIDSTDLKTATEDEMDDILDCAAKVNDKYFELRNSERLTRTGHGIAESWSLYDHVLDDLLYNTKILIDEGVGWPVAFETKARMEIGVSADANLDPETKEKVDSRASEMWIGELNRFRELIMSYRMFSDYGIANDEDAELSAYFSEHKSEIPLMKGTDGEIDYRSNGDMTKLRWNAIWDWMKENGESLWS